MISRLLSVATISLVVGLPGAIARPGQMSSPSVAAIPTTAESLPTTKAFKKVFMVVLENADYDDAAMQPFLSSLARQGALLTNLSAEAHPSQPNYLALIAGSTFGVRSDRNVDLDGAHLGTLLESGGRTWKVYAEGFPGNCFLGEKDGGYVRKHTPFLSFRNVQMDAARCARIVNADELERDLQGSTLPDFSLYVPDLRNDGHDTSVAFADRWLAERFGPLLRDARFNKDLLFVVTFDEDEHFAFFPSSNRVFTALWGTGVRAGAISELAYSHFSVLRTIEDGLGIGTLGREDAKASSIGGVWR